MGQKVNPNGFRVGVIRDWNTRWYANKKDFANFLVEDKKIRDYFKNKYFEAGIAKIDIARAANKVTVSIHTARPGMLIGKGGVGVDAIKAELNALVNRSVNIKGIKSKCGGRLGGAEIARTEGYNEGSTPLQTIRADIEYGFTEAKTAYGRIGVKVWIYKGEVLNRNRAKKA